MSARLASACVAPACLALAAAAAAQRGYEFVVDGEPCAAAIEPVEGAPGRPTAGDVAWIGVGGAWIGGVEFVLDEPGRYHLRADARRLWRVRGEQRQLLAVVVGDPDELADLTAADWRALRGVTLMRWSRTHGALLERIDPARCLVTFSFGAWPETLPELPPELRYLDLEYSDLTTLDGIERLPQLRLLRLPNEDEIDSVAPLAALRQLRRLGLDATGVTDLSPLTGLPQLRFVTAVCAPIATLPGRVPELVELIAYRSGCAAAVTARCAAQNPGARVRTSCRAVLVDVTAGAAHLRIRSGSVCHPTGDERELYTTSDQDEVAAFVALLDTTERHSRPLSIPGCGNHAFELRAADGRLLAAVELIGDHVLRGPWGGMPASLRPAARAPFRAWLRARGVELPR